MSVRNARLQALIDAAKPVVARNDRTAAAELVSEFREYSAGQLSVEQLIASADLCYTAEVHDLADHFYSAAHREEPTFYWPIFQVGRLRLQSREFDTATTLLERVTVLEPHFAWGWYELCRCYHELRQTTKLAGAVTGLAHAGKVSLTPDHVEVLTKIAHFLFEEKFRQEPFEVYSILLAAGHDDDLVRTRHAEFFIWKKQYNQVVNLLEPCLKDRTLGVWGRRALALAYEELGQSEEACGLLSEILREKPRVIHFVRDAIRNFTKYGDIARANEIFGCAKQHFTPEQQLELQLTLLSESRQATALLTLLKSAPASTGAVMRNALDRAIVDSAYKERNYDVASALISERGRRFGMDERTVVCAVNIAFAQRNWGESAQLLANVPPEQLTSSVELRLKRFEHLCFTNDIEGARLALQHLGSLTELAAHHLLPIAKWYAETGDWPSVVRILLGRLDQGFAFGETGYLLIRAIRKIKGHTSALREVDAVLDQGSTPPLERLRAVLLEDIADSSAKLEALSQDDRIKRLEFIRQRLVFKRLVFRPAAVPASAAKYAIYYCANSTYLGPSFVSIVSLINSNRDLLEDCDIFLVTENNEQRDLARQVASQISEKNALRAIVVMARDDIIASGTTFKQSYGLFTGGHSLAEAAYYRIYFAEYLNSLGLYKRALYIDSDTVVHGDLSGLFRGAQSAPLMARLEVERPEIAEAVRRHKFEKGRYFNSGVLSFDLTDLRLELGLRRSIHAIDHSRDTLMFQDQCALNLGFQNLFAEFDTRYNWFVTPFETKPSADGAILHFLDRPKPWDPMYDGELGRLWFLNWHRLAMLVGRTLALELHAMSLA